MSPMMNQERDDQQHLSIEIPESPSDPGMAIDARGDPLVTPSAIDTGLDLVLISDVRDDPQRPQDAPRIGE